MKSPLRIRWSALETVGGLIHYDESPFTGVAFDLDGGLVVDAQLVEQGEVQGQYRSPYFDAPAEALHVDETCPDIDGSKDYDDQNQFVFRGEVFNGVYYEFQREFCIYEGLIVDGFPQVETDWFVNGDLESYASPRADFEYDRGHKLRYLALAKNPSCAVQMSFSEAGAIKSLRVLGPIFAQMGDIVDGLPFHHVRRMTDLARYKAADEISLEDGGFDDELFQFMLDSGCFDTASKISLFRVKMSDSSLKSLTTLPNLRSVDVYDRPGRLEKPVLDLKAQAPNLTISYTGPAK